MLIADKTEREGGREGREGGREWREGGRERVSEFLNSISFFIIIVIDLHTIDPLPPPTDVQLIHVKPNQLTFNWSSVQPGCSTLQYSIESNCGTCINHQQTMLTSSALCSFELPVNSNDMCSFAIRSTICDSITGTLSTPVRVTLRRRLISNL